MADETLLERILNRDEEPKDLPLPLLQSITNDFSEERKIGQGGFGVVYKGELQNGIIVAVKRMILNEQTVDDVSFRREINSLMKINHQNVVRFLGFCSHAYHTSIKEAGSTDLNFVNIRERLLCLEYISNGSLDEHITDELRGLEWETRYEIIMGICKGLCYLHTERQIIHMDLKPANILLDDHMVTKITDFGLSRPNENSHTMGQRFGTRGYLAPEYENAGRTSFKSDIYSLGAILIELVTGRMDVSDKNNVLRRWRHRWSKPPTLLQYEQVTRCMDIAVRCRHKVPEARPSILEIISFLSKSESTDVHTGQISPRFHEDDMLGIKPLQILLPSELKNEISCSVELTNDTLNCIAFNIEPPSVKYIAQPVKGTVQPKSKCGVKIIVQPRDMDHADKFKFIVQSMQVEASEGLRDEDITKYMSRAEAGKVDEVILMVVYEPMQPQENCKHIEDTNTTAEEVPERKIVESAYGKGKLGSSQNADAASMDINSSARGQCTEQIEQCKLHPLQCFSRHYPTNRKYLRKESDRAVDHARGAMGSLLDKLGKLVTEDYNLEKSIKREIESFSEDLAIMHRDLPKLENVDGANIWVDEVRELSYHIEDMVDSFLVHAEPYSNRSGFRELTHEGLKLWENVMMTHHQIGDVIREIKNQVQAVADRQKKYNFDVNNVEANATVEPGIDDLRKLAMYEDKENLIGIETARNELIRLLEEDGDVSEQNLKIVSIVGLGGLGKTTLAKAVYDELQAQYHTRAFVPVGRNPDVKIVLKNIISELENNFNAENLDVWKLIEKLNNLLKNKRYFIVIDDLWDSEASLPLQNKQEAWSFIKCAFPGNNHGKVITTTRNHDVALACCNAESKYVYEIKPLGPEESRKLFLRRTLGPKKDCPDTLRKKKNSVDILKRCGGMPLAINSIASFLAGKPETTWEYVWKSLGAMTEGNIGLEKNVTQILDLSYIHLPDHLKTCLLYVCKYQEDREIDKSDLLRQWVAEGFVITNGRLDAEDVAENYFRVLINMCMIQPGKMDYNNEVLSCRVHDIILDLMRSKSSEVNFIQVIDGSKDVIGTRGEIRRVSVQYNDKEDSSILATIKGSLEHVRSVVLYRIHRPHFLNLKHVRVLHLEHEYYGKDLDLTYISRMLLLRYLKIAFPRLLPYQMGYMKLPDQIGDLQQLETIDLTGAKLKNYPSDIVSLPWLSHLRFGLGGIALPDGIGMLKSLRTLVGICVYTSSVDSINGLSMLTSLRRLQIISKQYGQSEEADSVRMDALHSSICKLSASLRILNLGEESCVRLYVQGWIKSPFPQASNIRELHLGCCTFQRCPQWIALLDGLYKFTITVRKVAGCVSIVARLPSLAYFHLRVEHKTEEGSLVIPGGGAFQALKELVLYCKKESLTFEAGAMPKLEKLNITFRHHMARRFLPVGIEHLPAPTLKEIYLCMDFDWEHPKGHQDWTDEDWEVYHDTVSDECEEKSSYVHGRRFRSMMKRAFKPHHPAAHIVFNLEGEIVGEDDDCEYESGCVEIKEEYESVDDEEDCCREEDDVDVDEISQEKQKNKKNKIW